MGFKNSVKRLLGKSNIVRLKIVRQYWRYYVSAVLGNKGYIKCGGDFKVYSNPEKHVFFGYYDIRQENIESNKLLVHILDKDAVAGKTPIKIAYIDKQNGSIVEVADSNAWSWQQGARLRWSCADSNKIYFNNYDGDYCCELWDIREKKLIRKYSRAFYDISSDESYGLSVNFSRLQRLRPGYGYANKDDKTKDVSFPDDDGVFYVDLITGKNKLLITLKELAEQNGLISKNVQGYVNHISISPDSRKFIFFFLWTENDYMPWENCLYLYDMDKNKYMLLEDDVIVSHYCWVTNEKIMITSIDGDYYMIDINGNHVNRISNKYLVHDGHPTYIKGKYILTDTYALEGALQHVFITDESGSFIKEVADIYSDPRMFDEKRCDTHPRISRNADKVTIDSTFQCNLRAVVEICITDL